MLTVLLRAVDKALERGDWPRLSQTERAAVTREVKQLMADGREAPSVAEIVSVRLRDRLANAPPPSRAAAVQVDPWRWDAMSQVAAADADALDAVRAFRAAHLPDGFIDYHAECYPIGDWLTAQVVAADRSHAEGLLAFADRASSTVLRRRFGPGTTLAKLATLSRRLAGVYGWSEDVAVAFVLCGALPRTGASRYGHTVTKDRPGFADRITLTLHPMVTAAEALETFEQARAWYVSDARPSLPRAVPVREHLARLAVFVYREFAAAEGLGGGSRDERWRRFRQTRPDLPDAWKAGEVYQRLASTAPP